jgi:hypothetical protein
VVLSMAMSEPCAPESCSGWRGGRGLPWLGELDVDDVAGLDEGVGVALAGPLPVFGQDTTIRSSGWPGRTDAGVNLKRQDAGDERVDVVAGVGFTAQSGCR